MYMPACFFFTAPHIYREMNAAPSRALISIFNDVDDDEIRLKM